MTDSNSARSFYINFAEQSVEEVKKEIAKSSKNMSLFIYAISVGTEKLLEYLEALSPYLLADFQSARI